VHRKASQEDDCAWDFHEKTRLRLFRGMFFSSGSCGKKGKKSEISSEKEETLEPDPLV